MAAVQQIERGSQQQASATHETSAALAQIENSGKFAQKMTRRFHRARLADGDRAREKAARRSGGWSPGSTRRSRTLEPAWRRSCRSETVGRRIEKIVDAIASDGACRRACLR